MAIKFACPTCQHAFKTDDKFAGRQATCPSCQNKLTIPNPEPELLPAADRPVAYNPKPSRSAPPPPRPFDDGELNENFNPFASPQAEDTRPSFHGMYQGAEQGAFLGYASFWKRFVAAFVDGFLTNIIGLGVGFVIGFTLAILGLQDLIGPIAQLAGIIVGWLYCALSESSSHRATPGKRMVGIQVTDLNGNTISFGRATGRHFGKLLSFLLLFIGYLMQPFTERKQALHDMMAGCVVVRVK